MIGPDGFIAAQDALNGGDNSSRIPPSGSVTLPLTGKYIVEATSVGIQQTGNYCVNVSLDGCVLTVNPTSHETQSAVTVTAEDNQMNSHPLTVEFVGKVPGLGRLTQIVVALPSSLPLGQEVRVTVSIRGKTSNKVRVRIK